MGDSSNLEEQVNLPTADLVTIDVSTSLLPPLSRKGYGPGLIIVLANDAPRYPEGGTLCVDGIPPPLLKWSEEGFAVVEIRYDGGAAQPALEKAVAALKSCETCDTDDGLGLVCYDPGFWKTLHEDNVITPDIAAVVAYGTNDHLLNFKALGRPLLVHLAGEDTVKQQPGVKVYTYPSVKDSNFAVPCQPSFDTVKEAVAHTRNLTFLKKYIRGLDFDLEAIWEEHTYFEFVERSVPKTMATMVQEPYVNHIPTMTGGIGRNDLAHFYATNFIPKNPADTELVLVSRTVGIDRVVDEFVMKMTHDKEVDWLAPGIPPTGKKVQLPMTSVVCVRGDRLYHEHIAWDQASLLIQLGLMPEHLTMQDVESGKKFEFRIPAAGDQTATKMLDKNAVSSNKMFEYKIRELGGQ